MARVLKRAGLRGPQAAGTQRTASFARARPRPFVHGPRPASSHLRSAVSRRLLDLPAFSFPRRERRWWRWPGPLPFRERQGGWHALRPHRDGKSTLGPSPRARHGGIRARLRSASPRTSEWRLATADEPVDRRGRTEEHSHSVSDCPVCKKAVVIDPDVLPDGRIAHVVCKRRWMDAEVVEQRYRQPNRARKSASHPPKPKPADSRCSQPSRAHPRASRWQARGRRKDDERSACTIANGDSVKARNGLPSGASERTRPPG